jgi:hypothetical protein
MELLGDLLLDLLGDLIELPWLRPSESCLMRATSVSLIERTKSTCLSGNRVCTTSMRAGSLVSTWRIRNTARGASETKCSSLART